jgi:hypothetical protein
MDKSVKKLNLTGIVFSIIVTAGFVWAAMHLYAFWAGPGKSAALDIKSNEVSAFLNLQLISQAQKKYKEADWDKDGKKTFAKYFIHLWSSVGCSGEPIYVGLIPKKLAFAIETTRAIDGYYFVDLHDRVFSNGETQRLDYEKEWAVLAVPVGDGQRDAKYFLADSSDNIFVKTARYIAPQYFDDLISNGWTKIDTIKQLTDRSSFK